MIASATARRSSVMTEFVQVTPELAEQWLAQNRHNRNVRDYLIDAYARDMADGRWTLNGEAIKFGTGGLLLDGQHRLHAVAQSGVTVEMLIVRGLAHETQMTMDAGTKRTAGDGLRLAGISNPIVVAAIARRALLWEKSEYTDVESHRHQTTHREIFDFVARTPDVCAAASAIVTVRHGLPIGIGLGGFCLWACTRVDADHAALFFDSLVTGAQLDRSDPILILRNKLIALNSGLASASARLNTALVFKAWNFSRDGKQISVLKFGSAETFPIPH